MMSRPRADVEVSAELAASLVAEQVPDLCDQPVIPVGQGWDCALFRVGADLAVRLPIRQEPASWLPRQAHWLSIIGPRLPLPVPVALHLGAPGHDYPYPWEVVPWFPGHDAIATPPADPLHAAQMMGEFVASLAQPAPSDAPQNPYRGGSLVDRSERTQNRLNRLAPDDRLLRSAWDRALDAETYTGPPVWLHGDLHLANLLVSDGKPSAVIDWIDICAGDPATDLAIAWYGFETEARDVFFAAAGHAENAGQVRDRARGWALTIALAIGPNDPVLGEMAKRTLGRIRREMAGS